MGLELSLFELGWTSERQRQWAALGDPTLRPARVSVQHRGGGYELLGCDVTVAQLAGRRRQPGATEMDTPAVGDWVVVAQSGSTGIIHGVLPRFSTLKRRRAETHEDQVLATNVDVVLVVVAVGRELNARRLERYLAAAWAGGARPIVVVNKADAADDVADELRRLATIAGDVPCLATSARTGAGIDALRVHLPTGATGVLVGSSGVGKSSLLNRLLGEERQDTGAVRDIDDKGRHTTTRRQLVRLPGAGCVIDTPGMREFGLSDADAGVDETFGDIEALASACRFRDCRHGNEPGCAVRDAVASGALPADRVGSFAKLHREGAVQRGQRSPRAAAAEKNRSKSVHKQQRARRKVDPKLQDD